FPAARAALQTAKRRRQLVAFGGFPPGLEPLASYYSALYWSWTPRQRRAATLLRLGPPAFAAAHLQVDRRAISHLARRMAWPLVAAGDKMFQAALLEAPRRGPHGGGDRDLPRPRHWCAGAGPRTHPRAARPVRRRRLDHRRQVTRSL